MSAQHYVIIHAGGDLVHTANAKRRCLNPPTVIDCPANRFAFSVAAVMRPLSPITMLGRSPSQSSRRCPPMTTSCCCRCDDVRAVGKI